ncbi:MAG: hypothetical protein HKP61_10685 [Dactylosporangium sp.]|nr:hypothetical protein [Dactylosporangium sp.]NNJ61395.1 hypothetical protein [Dactylosporangium sp.]
MTQQPPGDDFPTQSLTLHDDAFDDDLADQLEALEPRRLATRTTLALASVVLVVAGFLGGVLVQQQFGSSSGSSAAGNARAAGNLPGGGFPSGMGRQGQAGASQGAQAQQGSGGSATTGKVKLVDGTTVYLETADGQVITVKTDGETAVRTTTTSSLAALAAGTQVTVEGTADGNTVTATTVTAGQ